MLRWFQERHGLTNRQMAVLCGCSMPTIQKWRNGSIAVPLGVERLLAITSAVFDADSAAVRQVVDDLSTMSAAEEAGGFDSQQLEQKLSDMIHLREYQKGGEMKAAGCCEAFETLDDAVVVLRDCGTICWVNQAAAVLLGQGCNELEGCSIAPFLSEDASGRFMSLVGRVSDTGKGCSVSVQLIVSGEKGPLKNVSLRSFNWKGSRCVAGVFERVHSSDLEAAGCRAALATKEPPVEERRNDVNGTVVPSGGRRGAASPYDDMVDCDAAVLRASGVGLWQWYVMEDFFVLDSAWQDRAGLGSGGEKVAMADLKAHVHQEDLDAIVRLLTKCRRGIVKHFETECRLLSKNEDWIWVRFAGAVSRADGNKLPVKATGIFVDITPYKEREDQLVRARLKAEEAMVLRSDFLAGVCHRLRTPMASILGAAHMVEDLVTGSSTQELVEVMLKNSADVMACISQLSRSAGDNLGVSPSEKKRAGSASSRSDVRRVLVAEDNHDNRLVMRTMLQRLGCDVVEVSNGYEAVEAVKEQAFSIILMDIEMPVMNGLEAAGHIRQLLGARPASERPIICATTAYAMPGDREKYLASGMDAYLAKPISLGALSEFLSTYTCPEKDLRSGNQLTGVRT